MDKNKIANIHEILYSHDQNSCVRLSRHFFLLPQGYVTDIVQYFKKDARRYHNLHYIMVKAASDSRGRYNRLVKQLIKAGLEIDFESNYGTALSGAIIQNNVSLFSFLIKRANLNHINSSGKTPLFYAAFYHRTNLAYHLLKKGAFADQSAVNFNGETIIPLQLIHHDEISFFSLFELPNFSANLSNIFYSQKISKILTPSHFKQFSFIPQVEKLKFQLSKPLMIDSTDLNLLKILEICVGRTTKLAISKFKEAIVSQGYVNSDAVNRAVILKYLHPEIKADSIYLAWENVGLMSSLYLKPSKLPLLKEMFSKYGFNRNLMLFSDTSFHASLEEIVDLWVELTKTFSQDQIRQLIPKKPKAISEIHWILSSFKNEQTKSKSRLLNQPMLFATRDLGKYEIYLPKDRPELIYYSFLLRNCIDSERYENNILSRLFYIAIILEKGKAAYCVRYDQAKLLEIKGYFNHENVPLELIESLSANFTPLVK